MDEGLAALVAGIAGTVGALGGAAIGGFAAVRGSRIGAEKGAEALRVQVQDQLLGEQRHWVREQRRQSCAQVLEAYDTFVTQLATLKTKVEMNHEDVQVDDFRTLNDALAALSFPVQQLKLWGPTALSELGHNLAYRAGEACTAVHASYDTARRGQPAAPAEEQYEAAEHALVDRYAQFVASAGTTLRAPDL